MMIRLLVAVVLVQPTLTPVATASVRPLVGMGLTGSANHRKPVPGEPQTVRWVVRNLGRLSIERVWLETAVPKSWQLKSHPGCHAGGRLLRCAVGDLKPGASGALRIRMIAGPRLGPIRLRATTGFEVAGRRYEGPAAGMRLEAVRHRGVRGGGTGHGREY